MGGSVDCNISRPNKAFGKLRAVDFVLSCKRSADM